MKAISALNSNFCKNTNSHRNLARLSCRSSLWKALVPLLFVPVLANAAVTFGVSGVGNNSTYSSIVWDLSDLNAATPTIASAVLGSGNKTVAGTFSGAGTFGSGETLSVTMTASTSWVKADAINNLANFGTYVSNLTKEDVFIFGNNFMVGDNSINGTMEALFITVNTGNTTGPVSFTDMGFQLTGGTDNADFLIWDFETQTLLADQNAKSTSLPLGSFSMTTGDILVIATTPTNTNDYRVANFTLDIAPEPSRTMLFGAGLTLLAARRRRSGLAD